jgi:hypothetical protein
MVLKGAVMENKRRHGVFFVLERRIGRVGRTCAKKPQTLFDITHIFNVVLGFKFFFFSNKMSNYVVIWIDVFSNTKNIDFYNEFYVHVLCEFFVVLDYDEMNCNLVFGVFYNVF